MLAQALNEAETISIGRVQAALRKLERDGGLDDVAGEWILNDAEFAAWIISQDT